MGRKKFFADFILCEFHRKVIFTVVLIMILWMLAMQGQDYNLQCQGKPLQYGNTNILISVLDHSFAVIMEFSTIFVNF